MVSTQYMRFLSNFTRHDVYPVVDCNVLGTPHVGVGWVGRAGTRAECCSIHPSIHVMYVCMYATIHTCHVCMHVCNHPYMSCMYACMQPSIHVMYVCMYATMCVHTYVCTFTKYMGPLLLYTLLLWDRFFSGTAIGPRKKKFRVD